MTNPLPAALIILLILLVTVFTMVKNRRDKKELEDSLNQDYRKPMLSASDTNNEPAKI